MQIQISPYELKIKKPYRDFYKENTTGILLRILTNDGYGYSLIQTWPHLGEPSLNDILFSIEKKQDHPLLSHALEIAKTDALARKNKIYLNMDICLKSYHSLIDFSLVDSTPLDTTTIKIKLNPKNIKAFIDKKSLFTSLNIIVDCNLSFDASETLTKTLLDALDGLNILYIEDLHLSHPYKKAGDQIKNMDDDIWIIKPVKERLPSNNKDLVFTSNLDHPLGQAIALYYGGSYYNQNHIKPNLCGINTGLVYEENDFSKYVQVHKDELSIQQDGYGFGMQTSLDKLKWVSL